MIKIKRVYEALDRDDGRRFLVDRLWPRGIRKETLHMEAWLKEVAPSIDLCRWFGHDPEKWDAFQRRYWEELGHCDKPCELLRVAGRRSNVTLLFSARDTAHNNAVALKAYLEGRVESGGRNRGSRIRTAKVTSRR